MQVGTQQHIHLSLCPTFSGAHDLCNLVDEGIIIIMSLVVSDDRLHHHHHLSHAPINNPHGKISIINF
jgi:hypothetical protein